MVKNCIKKTLSWNRFSHLSDLASFLSEHCHPLGLGYLKTPVISEHCHPKSKCINLFIFLFRSIATHHRPIIAFRSIATHYRPAFAFRSIWNDLIVKYQWSCMAMKSFCDEQGPDYRAFLWFFVKVSG